MMTLLKAIFGASDARIIDDVLAHGAVIVDVRSAVEFAGGHANGAINIPLDQLDTEIARLKAYNKPIVVCCASGMRSAQAKNRLIRQGIENVYDAGGWRNIK